MLFCGDTNSPDKLAPDIIPVTPENKTPKTMKKSTSTKGSEQSLEYLEVLSTIVFLFIILFSSLENHKRTRSKQRSKYK